jgi:hypothetical protein
MATKRRIKQDVQIGKQVVSLDIHLYIHKDGSITTAPAVGSNKFPLPAGIIAPIGLKNELIRRGLAPPDTRSQVFYAYVKNPGLADPFPVRFFDEDGSEYDRHQFRDGQSEPFTRPGLYLDEGIAWWQRRQDRIAAAREAAEQEADQLA